MSDDGDSLGHNFWHLYLIYGILGIFIYALIMEFTLVNFDYIQLKSGIGDDNFGRRE